MTGFPDIHVSKFSNSHISPALPNSKLFQIILSATPSEKESCVSAKVYVILKKKSKVIIMKFLKVFFFNIIKYLFAFTLVLLTSMLLYENAHKNVQESLLNRTRLQIHNGLLTIEENIDKLNLIAQTIYENDDFSKLGWLNDTSSPAEKVILLRNSNELLKNTCALTDGVPYAFVLFRDNDFFLSTTSCSTSFNDYYNKSMIITLPDRFITDAKEIKALLMDSYKNNRTFINLANIRYFSVINQLEQNNTLLFLSNGVLNKSSTRKLFCFVLDREYLLGHLLTAEMQQHGFLSVRNTFTGESIFTYGAVPANFPRNIQEDIWIAGTSIESSDTDDYYYLRERSSQLGWEIISGISQASVTEQMASVQKLLKTYLWMGMAIALFLSIFLSISKYYGLKKVLLNIPSEELVLSTRRFYRAYPLISANVSKLYKTKEAYKQKADELSQQNRAILLENLITRDEGYGQELKVYKALFPQEPKFYCVVLVRFLQSFSPKVNDTVSLEMKDYLKQKGIHIIHNVRSGAYDELFLLELSGTQEENTAGLLEPFYEMAEILTTKYNYIMHIGISTVGTKLSNITRCYTQAKQVVQSQYLYDKENIVQLYNIMEHAFQENPVTIDFLTRFYNMLLSVHYQNIMQELAQLEKRCIKMPWLYEAYREEIFFSLKNIFHSAIIHLNCNDGEQHLPAYFAAISCPDMIQAFRECAEWLCSYVASIKKHKSTDLKERILEILEQEYQDPNLSAYTVSQKIGISEKYLYQFWKNQTGETFVASLFRIRIEKAQEYLVQTDYSNAKIAELTGFSSVNTFYRNFQKQTGISPKKYQEHQKQPKKAEG